MFNNDKRNNPIKKSATEISASIMDAVIGITEVVVSLFKAFLVIGGIIALNAADVLMGTIALTIFFGGAGVVAFGVPVWQIAGAFSMSASAIQIYFWAMLDRRGIGFKKIWEWNKLPKDVQAIFILGLSVAIIDTFIDVSSIPLLIANSPYKAIPNLFNFMLVALITLAVIVCGFAEKFTTGMSDVLRQQKNNEQNKNSNPNYQNKPSYQSQQNSYRPNNQGAKTVQNQAFKPSQQNINSKRDSYKAPMYPVNTVRDQPTDLESFLGKMESRINREILDDE